MSADVDGVRVGAARPQLLAILPAAALRVPLLVGRCTSSSSLACRARSIRREVTLAIARASQSCPVRIVKDYKDERDEILAAVAELSNHITSDPASKTLRRYAPAGGGRLCGWIAEQCVWIVCAG